MPTWSLEETRRKVRGSMRDSFPQLFGDRWREAGDVFYARFEAMHLDAVRPLPGAEALIAEFHRRGILLGVVSNKKGDYLRQEADHLGWSRYFHRVVGAFDAVCDKPAVEPVDMALAGSGVDRGGGVWFVGDADVDLECATRAGCIPVLVRPEPPAPAEFGDNGPAIYAADCEALCKLVRTL